MLGKISPCGPWKAAVFSRNRRRSLSLNQKSNDFGGRKGVNRTGVLREPSGFLQEK